MTYGELKRRIENGEQIRARIYRGRRTGTLSIAEGLGTLWLNFDGAKRLGTEITEDNGAWASLELKDADGRYGRNAA